MNQVTGPVMAAHEKLQNFSSLRDFCISDDGNEIYFTVQSPSEDISRIAFMKKVKGKWSDPELMPFSKEYSDLEPFLSPDQLRLYFVSNRPLDAKEEKSKDYDIWYTERKQTGDAWSDPVNLGAPVNSPHDEFYPSLSRNGNLYFTADRPGGAGKDDIYCCRWKDKSYEAPVMLGGEVSSSGYEFNAFISRDEKFMIYTRYNSPGGKGSGDLYIVYRDTTGNWQGAKNLGEIVNTKFMEYCPYYDEKQKLLYFTSKRNALHNRHFNHLSELQDYIRTGENGLSKIYKVKLEVILP